MLPRDRLPLLLLALAGSLGMHLVAQQVGLVPAVHRAAPVVVVALTCAAVAAGRTQRWDLRTIATVQLPVAALLELVVHGHAGAVPAPATLLLLVALHAVGVAATGWVADLLLPACGAVRLPATDRRTWSRPAAQVSGGRLSVGDVHARGPPSTMAISFPGHVRS